MNRSFLSVIGNRHFRNLWLGQITSQISLNMLNFVLAIRVYEVTHSNAAVSGMLLTFGLPAIVMGVIAGGIVEYYDKRSILIFCNLARTAILLTLFFFSDWLPALYLLNILMSVCTQLFIPAEAPAISQLASGKDLLRANSLFSVTFFLSTMLGFVLAGPLVGHIGYRPTYLVMAGIMILATYFVCLLPPLNRGRIAGFFSVTSFHWMTKTLHQGFVFIKDTPRVRRSLLLVTISQALIATLVVLAPGFADKILAVNLTDASYIVMGPAAAGLIIGALFVGDFGAGYRKGTLINIGILGTAATLILLSIASVTHGAGISLERTIPVAMGLLFFLGFFNSWVNVPSTTILQQDSEERMRGRVYGVLTSLTGGVSLIPVLFSGILADVIGIGNTMACIGVIVFLAWFIHRLMLARNLRTIHNR